MSKMHRLNFINATGTDRGSTVLPHKQAVRKIASMRNAGYRVEDLNVRGQEMHALAGSSSRIRLTE